jgi:hypothetical protein
MKKHESFEVLGDCIRQWIGMQWVASWLYSKSSATVMAKQMRKHGGHLVDDGDDFGTVYDLSF